MSFIPKPHEIYKHFKGNLYQITAIAEHSETGEQLVIYQALYGDFKTYARPLEMFVGKVDRKKYPDAAQEYRFELQEYVGEVSKQTKSAVPQAAQAEDTPTESIQDEMDAEPKLDPLLVEFLDADTYVDRLNILAALHHRITDEMITTMAIACDVEVDEGDTETRYQSLKTCLLTLEKYECNRMR